MDLIPVYYSLWAISIIFALSVTLRVFLKERRNRYTETTNGMVLGFFIVSFVPFMNVIIGLMLIDAYNEHFTSSKSWASRTIYKGDPNEGT